MEERRTFFNWVKCPIEFGKKFEYVIFRTDSSVYKYVSFQRKYKEKNECINALNFRIIFLTEDNKLAEGYIREFWPGWYNEAKHITKEEALEYLLKFKSEHTNTSIKENKKSWFNISDWLS